MKWLRLRLSIERSVFEARHDPCSLLEVEAKLSSPENNHKKLHVVLKQGYNSGSP